MQLFLQLLATFFLVEGINAISTKSTDTYHGLGALEEFIVPISESSSHHNGEHKSSHEEMAIFSKRYLDAVKVSSLGDSYLKEAAKSSINEAVESYTTFLQKFRRKSDSNSLVEIEKKTLRTKIQIVMSAISAKVIFVKPMLPPIITNSDENRIYIKGKLISNVLTNSIRVNMNQYAIEDLSDQKRFLIDKVIPHIMDDANLPIIEKDYRLELVNSYAPESNLVVWNRELNSKLSVDPDSFESQDKYGRHFLTAYLNLPWENYYSDLSGPIDDVSLSYIYYNQANSYFSFSSFHSS